jgi:putative YphP/YqiW family bacilliredoxin
MRYSEQLIAPMRQDLTQFGLEEARTAADVDRLLSPNSGTVLIVTNSVCGCAAGKARPGVALALGHRVRPDVVATVFAGADLEATARARGYFTGYAPSSPSIALFKNGKQVYMLERSQIENRLAEQIAAELTQAFDTFCATPVSA